MSVTISTEIIVCGRCADDQQQRRREEKRRRLIGDE
jgi:hypothetical protein